jgi:hypothetical protein
MSSRKNLVVALAAAFVAAIPSLGLAQATVPPQAVGPQTVGRFVEAVNNQATHIARLRRLTDIPGTQVTVINTATLTGGMSGDVDRATTRAGARTTSVRNAIRNHGVVSSALASGGINVDSVVALAVRGHLLNDVTVYYR